MGNGSFEESSIQALAARLAVFLPRPWAVSVTRAQGGPVDATVTITGSEGTSGNLDVTVKRWTTAPSSAVAGVLASVKLRTPNPLLLVTDYTNRPLRQACEELDISYIDDWGWALIKLDDPLIFIRTQGTNGPAPRLSSEVTRLNGVAVGRILRTLLEIQPPIGVRELAKRASVKSPGSVSKLLPTLVASGGIERDASGHVVSVKRKTLLERWTQDYTFLNGNRAVTDYLAPRGLDPVLTQVHAKPRICVTGGFAAKDYLGPNTIPVVPPTRLSLYATDPGSLATELGLIRVDRTASNVLVAVPQDSDLVQSPRHRESNLPLAPLSQVLADLLTLPGRESLLADQLIDHFAQSDPTWSL